MPLYLGRLLTQLTPQKRRHHFAAAAGVTTAMDGTGSTDLTRHRTRARSEGCPATEAHPGAADRLSALPDELLLHILSFLHILDAISTSSLSRRWRYLWHSLSSLDFTALYPSGKMYPPTGLVDRALLLHAAPHVELFRLPIRFKGHLFVDSKDSQVDSWVLFAVRRGVRVLDLDFLIKHGFNYMGSGDSYAEPLYGLPSCLFGCGSLEELTVRFCGVCLPSHVRLGSLKTMRLSWAVFYGDDLELLLSGCPLLQRLRLEDCNIMRNLNIVARENRHLESLEVYERDCDHFSGELEMEICAPSLKYLTFNGIAARQKYRVRDLSSLVVASFDLVKSLDYPDEDDVAPFADFLGQIHQVQVLKLSSWCLQALSVRELQGLCLSNVTSLELSLGLRKWELPGIFGTFQACNKLRILKINIQPKKTIEFKADFLDEDDFIGAEYLQSCVLPLQNVMQHLKTIEIQGFEGYKLDRGEEESEVAYYMCQKRETDIAFVGFLLEVSPVLEKMIVRTSNDVNKLAKKWEYLLFNLSLELLCLPRASPNARVIINGK